MPAASDADLVATCYVEIPAGDPSAWVQLMPAGELKARDGRRWRLGDAAAVVAASRELAGGADLVFDYEHQTDHAKENGREAPASGWIKELEVRGGDIWGRVEWTERALAMIKAREYRYVSPTFSHNPRRRGGRDPPRGAHQPPRAGSAGAGLKRRSDDA